MPILETIGLIYESYKLGETIGEKFLVGEHSDDVRKAYELYDAIDQDKEDNEKELREVLDCLKPVTAADKSYLWAMACFLKAECFFDLGNQKQAKSFISNVLAVEEETFTINKDIIRDMKEAAQNLLSSCISVETLVRIQDFDDQTAHICKEITDILVAELAYHDSFTGDTNTFLDLGVESWEMPDILSEIEEALEITFNDENLLGVSREDLEDDYEEEVSFNDIDIAELVWGIRELKREDEEDDPNAMDVEGMNQDEEEYLEMYNEYAADGEVSARDRRMLEKFRIRLGISEERAQELEASCSMPELTEDEQEYLEMYKEYAIDGVVSERDRKMLNKMRNRMGISEERAKEIEAM